MKSKKGFSMLEMIVAAALLATGIAAALKVFSSGLVSVRLAEDYSRAAILAHQVASDLERRSDIEDGPVSGDFGDNAPDYFWNADLSTHTIGLRRAEISVEKRGQGRHQAYEMVICFAGSSRTAEADSQ
jgi:prepilin-type N-terminal cleavage/methylation domain-containing protein